MKPAARGRNDKADRWSPGAREVESNDAPAGGRPGLLGVCVGTGVRREAGTIGKWLSIRKAWPAPMI
jgi:hypothetical protein